MKRKIGVLLVALFAVAWPMPVWGCTLWSATGTAVAGGGSIIAKNRDWKPNHTQELRLTSPRQGFRYYGLYAVGGDAPGLKAGVNEQGLVVISASASSLSREERNRGGEIGGPTARLLAGCASVEEALSKIDLFKKPQFLMLADRLKVAYVETAPDGRTAVQVRDNGILCHTNHYLDESLQDVNKQIGSSSLTRLERVRELLGGSRQFTLDDFIRISADKQNGPDDSLWRTGGKPGSARSLAAWIIVLPPDGGVKIYVKLANPGEDTRELQFDGKQLFSGQG